MNNQLKDDDLLDDDCQIKQLNNDSDTGMESMSSADLQLNKANKRNNSFCVATTSSYSSNSDDNLDDEDENKKLDELVEGLERLKTEKGNLLKQNVTCKTDIKKLKQR